MKKILLTAMPLMVAVAMIFKPTVDPLPIGSSVPKADIKMKTTEGKEVTLN